MGTKRPNSAPFDSTPNLSPADYKLQSGGKISPDPYPRTKMTGSTERERDTKQEENWRRETESEKMRDKARYREMDTVGGYCEKDRALAPQFREGERERRERRRMQEDDRGKNVRMLSNVERGAEREVKTGRIKGETFPRMGKDGTMANRRTKDEEKGEKRQRDQPQREETYQWERERQHRDRQRDETLIKGGRKEEEKNFGGRYVEDGRSRQRERHNAPGSEFQDRTREAVNLRDTRERDVARKREKPRPDMDEREARMYSPYRRTDGEIYTDMKVRENRRERRDARSEGDIDEREVMREREREETVYQHSRSEGDNWSATDREKNRDRLYYREREREVDRPRRREAEREREMYKVDRRTARQADRQGERWRERDDKRDDDRYREERRNRERKERRDDAVDRSSRSPTNSVPRIPAQVQSSKERSRDVNSETRYRRDGDRYEERDTRRERAGENERGKERWRDPERTAERRQKQLIRSERVESDRAEMTSHMPEQRRMWLEPQKGKNSKDEFVHRERHTGKKEWRSEEESSMESQGEWAREVRRVKDEPDERYLNPGNYKDRFEGRDEHREDAEGVSVDGDEESDVWRESDKEGKERWPERDVAVEGRQHRDTEGENVTNNTEETVREEEGGGHYWACSDSEGGSEAGKQDRDRIFSGEDGFVTVSSGEDDRGDEEEFKDCRETWEVGDTSEDPAPVGFKGSVGDEEGEKERTIEKEEQSDEEEKGGEKKSKYVFCVIGQTLSRSKGSDMLLSQDDQKGGAETSNSNLETHYNHSDDDTHRSQEDVHVTSDKNDHQPAIDNKNTESDAPQEDRLTLGETDDGDFRYGSSSELQHPEPAERIRTKVEPSHTEMGAMKRDSQTERLLKEWRETIQGVAGCERGPNCPVPVSPSDGVCSQDNLEQIESLLDHINTTAMSPEEVEAIKVRMNEAWSTSEVPKRHSQAPHLKWAKSVLREILGHSDEQTADEPTTEAHEDQGVNKSESRKQQEEADHETADLPVFTFTKYKQHSEPDMEDECLLEEFRDDEEDRSRSWSHADLRNVMDTIMRRKRNSKIFNAAQLYQQYSEAAQNSEILRQSRSDVLSVCGESIPSPIPSPTPSPPPARRPLPPLPPVPHPHSLSKSDSITSAKSLCLPEPPRNEGRPSSPRLSISLTNSSTLWRDLPGVRNSTELQELTEDQRRLQEVRFEVVTSEASYCRSLDIVVEYFVKSQQLKPLLTSQDRNWLFSRLADVRAISHSFLSKLEERVESDVMQFTVCDIIARQCQRFKMVYVPYLTNQSYQDATYQRLMNVNPRFKQIVEKLERSPVCQRLPLRSFLVLPFQRITRIKLLVQNIVKKTTPSTAEGTQAVKALRLLEKLIQESNESISQMQSIESLVSLSAKVDYDCKTLPLISQSRRLVREGPVTELMDFSLKENERNVYLHLFNDYLLLSLQKEGGRFTVIDHCPVSEMRVENCRVKLHSLQKNLIRLHMSNKALLLRTDTQSDKLRWISALSRPHPEIDFSAAQDFAQMQCIRAYVAQQPDELSLEKADIILVHQESSDLWVEGTRLSDRHYGWVPKSHLETINSSRVRQRNLSDALKLTTATATV
ncbi:trichohyalin isoform X2 [Cololabis saira]|uniref:trichohyalin isoform X2 n=1 Tax=Cololabis saira TaxID=129043 RepID=UPI002AD2A6D1|nr:trichohyalin isoform X2 [Cololabis saira]